MRMKAAGLMPIGLFLLFRLLGCRGCGCSGEEETVDVSVKGGQQQQEADRPRVEGEETRQATPEADRPGEKKVEKSSTAEIDQTGVPVVNEFKTDPKAKACPATMRAMATMKKAQERNRRSRGGQPQKAAPAVGPKPVKKLVRGRQKGPHH